MKWLAISGVLLLIITSCTKKPSLPEQIVDYQTRLSNVLGTKPPILKKVTLPPYPSLSELTHSIPKTSIKLFEFYQLKHCRLYSLVAQRNTTLGRVQLPSTRYLYERDLLQALQECIETTTDRILLQKLKIWQQTKKQSLPYVWADLLQKSTETKYALSANQKHVIATEQDGLSVTLNALHYLLDVNQNVNVSNEPLELHLQKFQQYALPAKLWLSQKILTDQLNHSTLWLKDQNKHLKCKNGKAEIKVQYLSNVFQRYFIKTIQPIASKMNHYQYQLQPLFTELSTHPFLSEHFKHYIQQHNQVGFEQYQIAIQHHIQFWQKLYQRCNIQPGK